MTNKLRGIFIPADINKPMEIWEVEGSFRDRLQGLQEKVGGWIERVTTTRLHELPLVFLPQLKGGAYRNVSMVVDEEGLYKGYSHNLRAEYLSGYQGDTGIRGDVILISEGQDEEGGVDYIPMVPELVDALMGVDVRLVDLLKGAIGTFPVEGHFPSPVDAVLSLDYPPSL